MRAKWTVILGLAAIVVMMMAIPAAGQEQPDLEPADRVLIHSYDPEAQQLLWSAQAGDSQTVADTCNIDEEPVDYEVSDDSATVGGGECDFTATDGRGPEGQVNHGTIVSNFVAALKSMDIKGGIGCYVRIIAQSDHGQGDDQVRVEDVDPDVENPSAGSTMFELVETRCGRPDHAGPPEGKGRPDHAGPPAKQSGETEDRKGPPEGAGKPSHAGPPDHAGKP